MTAWQMHSKARGGASHYVIAHIGPIANLFSFIIIMADSAVSLNVSENREKSKTATTRSFPTETEKGSS